MPTAREALGAATKIVADTGDLDSIKSLAPVDATTNPSLILAAVSDPKFSELVNEAIKSAKGDTTEEKVVDATDRLAVAFGTEITKLVPGYVSTEVDARLSYDVEGTIAKAKKIIDLYKEKGIDKSRILIKIASTYEGIKAAEQLEKEGITCNMTLLFNFYQAIAAAQAKATLISPFVGRILDWYKANTKVEYTHETDPGVLSVRQIYNYYKKHGHETIVMGASFRSVGEVLALCGCDRLTISPALLLEMDKLTDEVPVKMSVEEALKQDIPKVVVDEKKFRWEMNQDAMATEKLADGIRKFAADLDKLEAIVKSKL
jgi:transaldolase